MTHLRKMMLEELQRRNYAHGFIERAPAPRPISRLGEKRASDKTLTFVSTNPRTPENL